MLAGGVVLGSLIHFPPVESAFISACLSLSSTPLVLKFIASTALPPLSTTSGGISTGVSAYVGRLLAAVRCTRLWRFARWYRESVGPIRTGAGLSHSNSLMDEGRLRKRSSLSYSLVSSDVNEEASCGEKASHVLRSGGGAEIKMEGTDSRRKSRDEGMVEGSRLTDIDGPMLGILVMQDVVMGVGLAFLPSIAGVHERNAGLTLLDILGALVLMLFVTIIASRMFYYVMLTKAFIENAEIRFLVVVSTAFFMLLLTRLMGVSMELGCFLAGIIFSLASEKGAHLVEKTVTPVKEFFSCIFFAAIGLHIYPKFVLGEVYVLVALTIFVVASKFLLGFLVLKAVLPKHQQSYKWIMAAGLSQVSEFAFVLSSRSRYLGLISREVYLLILNVSTLSLFFAPFMWKFTLWWRHRTLLGSDSNG